MNSSVQTFCFFYNPILRVCKTDCTLCATLEKKYPENKTKRMSFVG